jgi:UDP-3-O-[3-hydroxymyristoyl] glucosamine N-acyltransferase
MEFKAKDIAALLQGEVVGDGEVLINNVGKIQDAEPGMLAFYANPQYEQYVYTTDASALLVSLEFEPSREHKTTLIRVDDPYLRFTQIIEEYAKQYTFRKVGIEEPSYIGDGSSVGEGVYRGAFSYIGNNVQIGTNVKIYPQCFIGDNVKIGDNCLFYPGVKIYEGTIIGNDCVLQAGVVLGSDGFGYAPQKDGSYKPIPQMGGVVLENRVHIGANTTVDCATFQGDATRIGEGTKLDNLIQLGHNVTIGSNTVMAAGSAVAGSSSIGNNCVLAGQVGVVGHIKIADRTTIAAQSGVIRSTKEGSTILGSPGFDHKTYLRSYAVFRKLPELQERVQKLERKPE